ncbi:MAG: YdeI/OmpD-associated family protein [Candidatus Aminicenantes bacterium]|nr:YdeI/OmpD-associated family protein [Candidatus Aminicenantes bacterium]
MTDPTPSRLKRPCYPMPDEIKQALERNGLIEVYQSRPPYQQNDYIGWIMRAKKDETKRGRLTQMLKELQSNDAYMKMPYQAK